MEEFNAVFTFIIVLAFVVINVGFLLLVVAFLFESLRDAIISRLRHRPHYSYAASASRHIETHQCAYEVIGRETVHYAEELYPDHIRLRLRCSICGAEHEEREEIDFR